MNEDVLLALLEEHISEITLWANKKLTLSKPEEVEEILLGDPIKKLPKELSNKLKDRRAFRRAIRNGFISYEQGVWYSHFNNASHFSYFCARCFCEDYLERGVLKKGSGSFPASTLQTTFRVKNIREARNKMLKTKISNKYKYIDILFDKCCN